MINTRGIAPARVVIALYDSARPQGLGMLHFSPESLTIEEAEALLAESKYFDYVRGRVLKVDLKNPDGFDEVLYDRDNGRGSAQNAIASMVYSRPEEARS